MFLRIDKMEEETVNLVLWSFKFLSNYILNFVYSVETWSHNVSLASLHLTV